MSEIKYKYALDGDGNPVNIINVDRDSHRGRKFTCIGCGRVMVAKMGEVIEPHFAHKSYCSCNGETYYHELGKKIILRRLSSDQPLYVELKQRTRCNQAADCILSNDPCRREWPHRYDLKGFYNVYTEEKSFGFFRADVLLEDINCNKPPILIEICNTHKCIPEKINSGLRIIEIAVRTEEDAKWLESNVITEDDDRVIFHNFTRERKPMSLKPERLPMFCIEGEDNYSYSTDFINCTEDCGMPGAVFSAFYPFLDSLRRIDDFDWDEEDVLLLLAKERYGVKIKGEPIKSCTFCRYYRKSYKDEHICCMYKNYDTNKNPERAEATNCTYYTFDNGKVKSLREYARTINIKVLEPCKEPEGDWN